MKQEDKDLLLKDLCARLPYNTMIHGVYAYENPDYDCGRDPEKILYSEHDSIMLPSDIDWIEMDAAEIKPYLFPMSSMSEEQKREYFDLLQIGPATGIDYLNKNHFDYRGLIEKGLAVDCTNLNIY